MESVFKFISGRFESPPSDIVWSWNLAARSVTALHSSWAYSMLLSGGLYKHPMMIGFFRSLQLTEAATNSDVAVVCQALMLPGRAWLWWRHLRDCCLAGLSLLQICNWQAIPFFLQWWGWAMFRLQGWFPHRSTPALPKNFFSWNVCSES